MTEKLLHGHKHFLARYLTHEREFLQRLAGEGQSPSALYVGCSDSRVIPELLTTSSPGELFVVRNVANLVPPYRPDAAYHGTSAALEFAVRALAVERLVVLGHAMCGGIQALLDGAPAGLQDFLPQWMAIAEPARQRALASALPGGRQRYCEHEAIRLSLANLRTFPWVRSAVEEGKLALHGCYFDIRTGVLLALDADGEFAPIAP